MSARDEVLGAATRRASALVERDEATLRDLLHERFVWTSHRGAVLDRDAYLAGNLGGTLRWLGQTFEDPHVETVGDTAVLRCIVRDVVQRAGAGPEVFRMPMTQTWVRVDGRWRCLAGHAGPRLDA